MFFREGVAGGRGAWVPVSRYSPRKVPCRTRKSGHDAPLRRRDHAPETLWTTSTRAAARAKEYVWTRSSHHGRRADVADETRFGEGVEVRTRMMTGRRRDPRPAYRPRRAGDMEPRERTLPRHRATLRRDRPEYRRAGRGDEEADAGELDAAAAEGPGEVAVEAIRTGTTAMKEAMMKAQELREAAAHPRAATRRRQAKRQAFRTIGPATRGTGSATTSRHGSGSN